MTTTSDTLPTAEAGWAALAAEVEGHAFVRGLMYVDPPDLGRGLSVDDEVVGRLLRRHAEEAGWLRDVRRISAISMSGDRSWWRARYRVEGRDGIAVTPQSMALTSASRAIILAAHRRGSWL